MSQCNCTTPAPVDGLFWNLSTVLNSVTRGEKMLRCFLIRSKFRDSSRKSLHKARTATLYFENPHPDVLVFASGSRSITLPGISQPFDRGAGEIWRCRGGDGGDGGQGGDGGDVEISCHTANTAEARVCARLGRFSPFPRSGRLSFATSSELPALFLTRLSARSGRSGPLVSGSSHS